MESLISRRCPVKALIMFSLASILVASTGCSTLEKVISLTNTNVKTGPSHESQMDTWIGQPLTRLESHPSFGVPMHQSTLSDGSIAYVYEFSGDAIGHYSAYGNFGNSRVTQAQCSFTFYSKEGVITQLNWRGSCRLDSTRFPETYASTK